MTYGEPFDLPTHAPRGQPASVASFLRRMLIYHRCPTTRASNQHPPERTSSYNRHSPAGSPAIVHIRRQLNTTPCVRVINVPQDNAELEVKTPKAVNKREQSGAELHATDSQHVSPGGTTSRALRQRGGTIPNSHVDPIEALLALTVVVPDWNARPANRFNMNSLALLLARLELLVLLGPTHP
jgi:hypothetical protein